MLGFVPQPSLRVNRRSWITHHLTLIDSLFSAHFRNIRDVCIFIETKAQFFNLRFQVVYMRAWRCVVIVFGDAGRQLNGDCFFADIFFLFDHLRQIIQFSQNRLATTPSAIQVNDAIRLLLRVNLKPAGPFIEWFFTKVTGTSLFNDVALYDCNITFIFHTIPWFGSNFCESPGKAGGLPKDN